MKEVQQAEALRLAEELKISHCGHANEGPSTFSEAAEKLISQHTRIAELEADLEAVGAGGVQRLAIAPQPCSRSHSHEEMTPMCELRTEIARLTNALARAEAQLAATQPAAQGMDALHKQMLSALESVGSHTVTDCDGDDVEVYFCNWVQISAAKSAALAAQAKQGEPKQ